MLDRHGLGQLRGIKSICSYSRKGLCFELWFSSTTGKIKAVYPAESEHDFPEEYLADQGFEYCGSVYRPLTMQQLVDQVYIWHMQLRLF